MGWGGAGQGVLKNSLSNMGTCNLVKNSHGGGLGSACDSGYIYIYIYIQIINIYIYMYIYIYIYVYI